MTCLYPASAPFQRPTTTHKTAENQNTKHAKKKPGEQEEKQNQGLGFYLKIKGFLPQTFIKTLLREILEEKREKEKHTDLFAEKTDKKRDHRKRQLGFAYLGVS